MDTNTMLYPVLEPIFAVHPPPLPPLVEEIRFQNPSEDFRGYSLEPTWKWSSPPVCSEKKGLSRVHSPLFPCEFLGSVSLSSPLPVLVYVVSSHLGDQLRQAEDALEVLRA